MRLELGSSTHPTEGYIHVDIAPACRPDVVADAACLPFADNSVTELRAVDILEHVSYRNVVDVAKEWGRVLAPGCQFYVQVPDAKRALLEMWSNEVRRGKDMGIVQRREAQHKRASEFNLPDHPDFTINWILMGGQDDGTFVAQPGDWRFNSHYVLFSKELLLWVLDEAGLVVDRIESNPHPNLCAWGHAA